MVLEPCGAIAYISRALSVKDLSTSIRSSPFHFWRLGSSTKRRRTYSYISGLTSSDWMFTMLRVSSSLSNVGVMSPSLRLVKRVWRPRMPHVQICLSVLMSSLRSPHSSRASKTMCGAGKLSISSRSTSRSDSVVGGDCPHLRAILNVSVVGSISMH
jgi:hypothetical protein